MRIRQAAVFSLVVVLFAALCANRALHGDALLAVISGVAAGFFLAFVFGCILMYFDDRATRANREAP